MDTKTRPLHLKTWDTYRLKVKGWKKIFHANRKQKKSGVAILIDFKIKAVKRDKEGHYIMIKGSIQEDITIRNIYASKSEKAMATHSSTLDWRIPWMQEPGRLQSVGSLRVRHI